MKSAPAATATAIAKTFDTPQQAADALVDAAEKFDEQALIAIFGPQGEDIVLTGEMPQDRDRAATFAAEAREKKSVALDAKNKNRAYVIVGNENWPFPVPIVKKGGKWSFDAKAGQRELLYRRIGYNELDAIQICRGYVEAQHEYAYKKREGYDVNQFAQKIISTPGKQDGLAWQNSDGTWGGPIGEEDSARDRTRLQQRSAAISRLLLQNSKRPGRCRATWSNGLCGARRDDRGLCSGGCAG